MTRYAKSLAISNPDSHQVLASAISIASGQLRRVRVRVAFDRASTNQSQALSLDFGFTTRRKETHDA